jgi:hypothetical protein
VLFFRIFSSKIVQQGISWNKNFIVSVCGMNFGPFAELRDLAYFSNSIQDL